MGRWRRFVSAFGEDRIIGLLGGVYTTVSLTHTLVLWSAGQDLSNVVLTHLLIGLPGVILLYCGYRLSNTELHRDVIPRIVARCFAGIAVMLGIVGLLAIGSTGGLNRPFFTPVAGTALGSVAGFAIGLNEARALSRAREAEQHRDELLRERNLRDRIVETSPTGIAVIDADGQISVVNEHAAEIVGYSEDELINLEYDSSMFEVTDANGNSVDDFIFERVRATGEPIYGVERQLTRADGQRIWLSLNATPLHDSSGDVTSVVITAEDITKRKDRERELRESKNQLQALIEVLPVAVFVAEQDGQIVEWNEAAERIWGGEVAESESVAEYEEYDGWWVDTGEPVEPEEWPLARALRGEEVTDPAVIEIEGFDGERRTVLNHGMPVRDADGEVSRAVVTLIDVTEREERKERLQEQNERLESFASMLAHELRNPVTIGQIYSQQLPADTDSEPVEYITEAFDRIEDIIDVMLLLTREGDAVGESTQVNLKTVAREAWEDMDAPDATLEVLTTGTMQGDKTYIRHLFRNLFENAVEHGRQDITVTVGELPTGFYVADDGPGISANEWDTVFETGYTTAADGGGTGLGLAFVRKLAETYDWKYTVTESDAGGAQFEFRNVDYEATD